MIRVAHECGRVTMEFGAILNWVAMPPASVRELARALVLNAAEIDGRWPNFGINL